jgi:3-oxoadipate enol-lactonase
MQTIETAPGIFINVDEGGAVNRPVLLLAHSVGCDLTLWDPQVAALADRFRIIRYDARGHGASTAPDGPYTVEQLGADALAVLDHFGVRKAHLCGLSLGGTLGQWLALNAPQRLASLTLCDTAARLGTVEGWQSRIDAAMAHGTSSIADMSMTRFFSDRFRQDDPETVERFRQTLIRTADCGFAGCCAVLRDCDFRTRLMEIAIPTLVMTGLLDVPTPPADSRELAARIHGAKLVLLDAGHISAVEAPAAFNAALVDHVTAVEANAGT